MSKRIIITYCICLSAVCLIIFRVYYISQGNYLTSAADRQSSLILNVGSSRGNIYDCNLISMTGNKNRYVAAVTPCPEAAAALANILPVWERGQIVPNMESGKPFTLQVPEKDIMSKGIVVFEIPQRVNSKLAVQTTGYLNSDGIGVYGVEKSFNDLLQSYGSKITLKYQVDAFGRVLEGIEPTMVGDISKSNGGIVLSIDSRIQKAAEDACRTIDKGAAVIMDINTGEIKALVSKPLFDPDSVSDYLDNPDSPFINRCASAFPVGSSFKLAVASAALEAGVLPSQTYECKGYVEIDEKIIRCNNLSGHGILDMQQAINKSCNAYFIHLALDLGAKPIYELASKMGFGAPNQLAAGMITAKGNLPALPQLVKGELANFGFGQGKLLATPIQLAQMTCTIANGGYSVIPKLVLGETYNGTQIDKQEPSYARSRILSQETSLLIREFMISTVETGSGTKAKPESGGAGGKTSSAQTGKFDENGEVVHAWFAGFFPADTPKYVCVILFEGGVSGSSAAAPVFKEIADAVNLLEIPK